MTIPAVFVHHVSRHQTGMYGVWMDNEQLPRGVTLQPDDKFLAPGIYRCKRDYYHTGKYETFEIIVPGHDRVLFHKGNWERHSKLCVLIAEAFKPIFDKFEQKIIPGISQSEEGFNEFWELYKQYEEISLVVTAREGILNGL